MRILLTLVTAVAGLCGPWTFAGDGECSFFRSKNALQHLRMMDLRPQAPTLTRTLGHDEDYNLEPPLNLADSDAPHPSLH